MAISKEQVYEAIEVIVRQGEKPTTIKIREYLGTGSLGTINPILKEWRESQAPDVIPVSTPQISVPQPFIDGVQAIIPQLWTVAAETANTMLNAERTTWTAEREELKNNLEEITALEAASATDLETTQQLVIEQTTKIETLIQEHKKALDEQINAKNNAEKKIAVLEAISEQKEKRIQELQENTNITNERNKTERAELQNLLNENKKTLESTIKELQEAQKESQTMFSKHVTEIESLTTNHATALNEQTTARIMAEQNAAVLKATNDQMQTRIDDLQKNMDEFKTKVVSLDKNLSEQVKATHAAENRATAAESTATALSQQVEDLKSNIKIIQDSIKPKSK